MLHGETDVLLDSYGILKVDERQYQALDRRYLLAGMREAYGYRLLTNERRYYQENYPDLVMEKGSIDDILILTARGRSYERIIDEGFSDSGRAEAVFYDYHSDCAHFSFCSGQPAQIIVGYCTMFGMLFTVNTISYDEFDHGYLFLFTLPVTRKDYVLEKICIYDALRRWFLGSFRSGRFCGRLYPGRCGVSFRMADAHVPYFIRDDNFSGSHASGQPEIRYGKKAGQQP